MTSNNLENIMESSGDLCGSSGWQFYRTTAGIKIDGYQFSPFRRDRNKLGGGEIVYLKDGLIVKILIDFENNISETISLELTISDKKMVYNVCIQTSNCK